MGKFYLSKKAVEDLTEIYEYTFENWSEKQADKYYTKLISIFNLLAKNPEIGRIYHEINSFILGFPLNNHIVFYRNLNPNQIEILRILGAETDIKNRFK
ncbi:type II toxin-antitoxin system RelE/ParE family toxin [Paenimyroides tangerinum]|uniref:Toxin n=1 Tax=Paenimyroides tangerinum TaxID=2488728 RepID=A0A3P3WC57_9FLAO|nr:type II toxin-antitoxin system RelE/ParE family toxin [Paenimyroides tangerinum]RRJ91616.1 type II toxin-antitoxin system RelE/ParE family toxin [Paenimyroides tangerinum]